MGVTTRVNIEKLLPINTKVRTNSLKFGGLGVEIEGFISGIAWVAHPIHGYIVTFKEPLTHPGYEGWTSICVTGQMITVLEVTT